MNGIEFTAFGGPGQACGFAVWVSADAARYLAIAWMVAAVVSAALLASIGRGK